MNSKHFRYIDEDKLLPFLEKQIQQCESDLKLPYIRSTKNNMYTQGYLAAIKEIKKGVEIGMWHWQEGSE